jgi:hypothetical protein
VRSNTLLYKTHNLNKYLNNQSLANDFSGCETKSLPAGALATAFPMSFSQCGMKQLPDEKGRIQAAISHGPW